MKNKAKKNKKITVLLPEELLMRATKASGSGVTQTLRQGLELVAAKEVYDSLLKMKGKFDLGIQLDQLREDDPS